MKEGLIVKKLADKFWVKCFQDTYVCTPKGTLKNEGIFVGDKVVFDEKLNFILSVKERSSLLIRPPIANLDQLIIVISPTPKPDFFIVDKLILFAFSYGIEPILCVNKCDILDDALNNEILHTYSNVLKIIKTSVKENNIFELLNVLKGKISALAGQSAVGKSALTKKIFPNEDIKIGDLSKIERGKHTTRHSELFEIDSNSFLADTSGFTSLDEKLLSISYFELTLFYPDFLKYLSRCKYRSCSHIKEENCAVKDAVKAKELNVGRYERYKIIYETLRKEWQKTHG